MNLTGIDSALWALGAIGQIVLIVVMVHRRFYRIFPIFTTYMIYSTTVDILTVAIARHDSPLAYFRIYIANLAPDVLFQAAILWELGRNVINPVKRSLPKPALYIFAAMLVGGTVLTFLMTLHPRQDTQNLWEHYFLQVTFTFAILRLVIFLLVASFAQMLGIGWKNHVLQIATGYASYSIVVVLVELLHHFTRAEGAYQYHLHEQFRIVGWCMVLGYWSYVLAKKEAARREFSPRMADFLISISGTVHESSTVVTRGYRK